MLVNVEGIAQVAVDDIGATRTVYLVVGALLLIGVLLVVLAAWLIRQTRPERELLAPLELMADRSWYKQDPAQKRRALDEVRPEGARPVHPEKRVPDLDEDFSQARPALATFDDLKAQLDADLEAALAATARTVDPSPPPTEIPDDEIPDTEIADTEIADTETADTETGIADAEIADTGIADAETADAEASDLEIPDVETLN